MSDMSNERRAADFEKMRAALDRISFLSTNHGGWFENDPFGAYGELGDIARHVLDEVKAA